MGSVFCLVGRLGNRKDNCCNWFAFACCTRSGAALSVGLLDSLIWGALRKCLLKVVQQRWGINNVI